MISRETKTLLFLLAALAALIVYRGATWEEPKRVKDLTYKPGAGAGIKSAPAEGERPEMKLTQSKTEKKGYRGVIRNPFQPLYPPPPPPPPVVAQKPFIPPPAPFPAITAKGPSPAQIESGKIKFLGFMQKEGEKKIFILRDKEVFIVKKGDIVSFFEVGEISDNSVSLIARDTKEEFKLVIEDVKPAKPIPGIRR